MNIELLKQKYKVIKKELVNVLNSNYLGVEKYKFKLNDGSIKTCEKITKNKRNGDAVVIISKLNNDRFLLILESRPLTKEEVILEFPAGMVDLDESFIEAAKRELLEETGYTSDSFEELEWHYQDQGCSRAIIRTYLASNCYKVSDQNLDKDEKIIPIELTYDELLNMLYENKDICDANTKIAIMSYVLKK